MYTFTHRNPEMELEKKRTALVLADIQNEFLSGHGSYYPLIEDALKAQRHRPSGRASAVRRRARLLRHSLAALLLPDRRPMGCARRRDRGLPRRYRLCAPSDPVDLEGFDGSGADYFEPFKKYLMDGKTCNTSPHKGFSTWHNDVIKQLRCGVLRRSSWRGQLEISAWKATCGTSSSTASRSRWSETLSPGAERRRRRLRGRDGQLPLHGQRGVDDRGSRARMKAAAAA